MVPKQLDDHEKAQMMGFIAYALNIENSVKMMSFSKLISLNEPHEKNRIFVTGTSMMSAKASASSAAVNKVCDQLERLEIKRDKLKRCNFLDRHTRQNALKKMKEALQVAVDLQSKYVELPEFKRVSCIDIERAVPPIKSPEKRVITEEESPSKAKGDEEEEEGENSKLKFPWHCEKGIVENALQLNDEFNQARNLKPMKVFITGPPASGKTHCSAVIAEKYNIPRVHVKEITDRAFGMARTEEEEGLAAEIKAKIEELKDAAVAKIEEERQEKGIEEDDAPEIDRDALQIRLPNDMIYDLLKARLSENDCRNRGYILDGFPRNYKDCQNVFLKREKKFDPETGEEIEQEEEPLEEGQEKSFEGYIIDNPIFPSSCIGLQQDDKFLINRIRELSEAQIAGTHYTMADMKRRLKTYRLENESRVAEPSVQQFFSEHSVQPFTIDADRKNLFQQINSFLSL